jgi:hypothetical protein
LWVREGILSCSLANFRKYYYKEKNRRAESEAIALRSRGAMAQPLEGIASDSFSKSESTDQPSSKPESLPTLESELLDDDKEYVEPIVVRKVDIEEQKQIAREIFKRFRK